MKLLDLNDPQWKDYPGAYGSVRDEVGVLMGEPAGEAIQLRRLEEAAEDDEHLAFENLCESLSHQMTFYPAMYVALPYMVKFLGRKAGDYEWQRRIFSEIGQCLAADAFRDGESPSGAPEEILASYREAVEILAGQAECFLKNFQKKLRKEGTFERRWLLLGLYGFLGDRREAYVMNMNAWETCCVQCGCGFLDEDLELSEPKQRRKLRPARIWKKKPASFRKFRKFLHVMGDWEGEELLAWYYGTYDCPKCGTRQPTMEALIRAFDPDFQEPEETPPVKRTAAKRAFSIPGRPAETSPGTETRKAEDASKTAKTKDSPETEAPKAKASSGTGRAKTNGFSGTEQAKRRDSSGTETAKEKDSSETETAKTDASPERNAPPESEELPDALNDNALTRALELCRDYPSILSLIERKEYREAADWCLKYLETTPDWRLHVLRACCFRAMGRTPELDRCLAAALELDPDNILILRARCPTVSTTTRYRRHVEDLTRLIALDPHHRVSYLISRAYRYHWTGNRRAAEQDLRAALAIQPDIWRRSPDFRALWEKFGYSEEDAENFQE